MRKKTKNKEIKNPLLKRAGCIAVCTVVLCLCMCGLLTLYLKFIPSAITALEEEGKMDNTIWLVRYGSLLPPVIILVSLLTLFYKYVNYAPIAIHIDKAVVILLVALFSYLVLFTVVKEKSQGWELPPAEGEEDIKSLLELCVGWFAAQILPFIMAFSYHVIRAANEKKALLHIEEVKLENEKTE